MPAPKGNRYAKGHSHGRPSKFRPKFIKELVEFFDIEPYRQEIIEEAKEYFADGRVKRENVKFKHMPNKLPTLYPGFSVS